MIVSAVKWEGALKFGEERRSLWLYISYRNVSQ